VPPSVVVRDLSLWIVTSAGDPGAAYETDDTACTCPAAQVGGDPVCLHGAAYWHHPGVLDFEGEPASPAPSQPAEKLIESFAGELDYFTGAHAFIREIDREAA
jgi:hypothetical protein